MYKTIYDVLCMVYSSILRPVLKKAVDDPNQDWDEIVMRIVDAMFNYIGE